MVFRWAGKHHRQSYRGLLYSTEWEQAPFQCRARHFEQYFKYTGGPGLPFPSKNPCLGALTHSLLQGLPL